MEEIRRLVARLGASSAAHSVPPVAAEARVIDALRPAVGAPPLVARMDVRASRPPATQVRSRAPGGLATAARAAVVASGMPATGRAAAIAEAHAHAAARVRGAAHRRGPVARPRVHAARGGGEGHGLRTLRRRRVPWDELSRERLAAAWTRVQTEHGGDGELLLVGVFGPVPIDSIASTALTPDGRLAMTFARRGGPRRRGDVALARHAATGRLVRCDIPDPSGT